MNPTVAAFSVAPVASAARPCGYGFGGWQLDQAKSAVATTSMATKPMASKRHLTTFGNAIDAGARLLRNRTT